MDSVTHAQIIETLDLVACMTVATLRSDGFPQVNVVSFVHDGLTIYFMTVAGSQKALNLLHSDKVSGTVTRPYDGWDKIEGVSFAGHASQVIDPDEISLVEQLMPMRFPQIAGRDPQAPTQTIVVRIDPVVFSILDHTSIIGHAKLVEVQPRLG